MKPLFYLTYFITILYASSCSWQEDKDPCSGNDENAYEILKNVTDRYEKNMCGSIYKEIDIYKLDDGTVYGHRLKVKNMTFYDFRDTFDLTLADSTDFVQAAFDVTFDLTGEQSFQKKENHYQDGMVLRISPSYRLAEYAEFTFIKESGSTEMSGEFRTRFLNTNGNVIEIEMTFDQSK